MKIETSASPSAAVMEFPADVESVPHLNDQRLHAHFHRGRILGGAVVVISVIATVMLVFRGKGVTIDTFSVNEEDKDENKRLADYYNSISGSIGSFVSKPVELYIGLLVATAYLCFATDFTIKHGSVGHWQYLSLLTAAALAYLFSNGMNSLNVQVLPGKITTRIKAEDLAFAKDFQDDQPLHENGSLSTVWDKSYAENASGNSVLNTILRSKLVSLENVKPQCNGTGFDSFAGRTADPVVMFGFRSQPWQIETLATAFVPAGSLKIPMLLKSPSALPGDERLPMSVNIASNLALFGFDVLSDLQLERDMLGGVYPSSFPAPKEDTSGNIRVGDIYNWLPQPASSASSGSSSAGFLNTSHALWLEAFNITTNVSVNDASVEYNHIAISSNIAYDALTIELPIAKLFKDKYGIIQEKIRGYNTMLVDDYCSREGCLIPTAVVHNYAQEATIQPRVQVASICMNDDGTEDLTIFVDKSGRSSKVCSRASSNSILVVGIGKRVEGDLWNKTDESHGESDGALVQLKNMRTVYSITIGRLSWETEDLAKVFGAECGIDGGCDGLRFQMQPDSKTSDYLVVGENSLMDLRSSLTTPDEPMWKSIVSGAAGMGQQGYDILSPRRFSSVTAKGAELRTASSGKCNMYVDSHITMVEKNHLYMEQSLQTSYTAAFYFLFQNAVRQKRLNTTAASESAASPQLAFAGNVQRMNVQVSIPTTNVIISLAGCFLVFVISIGIVSLAKRSEHLLQERVNAEIVAEAMMNSSKYPPWLLQMALSRDTGPQESLQVPLQDLRVQSVVLDHKEEETKRPFYVGAEI